VAGIVSLPLQQLSTASGLPAQAELLQRLQQQGEQALQGILASDHQ